MSVSRSDPTANRRQQILDAAMASFTRCGFHHTTMQDISAEAGISVGLIYRYFQNKHAVIAAMAEEHKRKVKAVLERAGQAPHLLDALEMVFTVHCTDGEPERQATVAMDLFAEAGRDPSIAALIRDVREVMTDGLAELIAGCPEAHSLPPEASPRHLAELILAINRGMIMDEVVEKTNATNAERREYQLNVVRRLWKLLFGTRSQTAAAA